MRTRTLPRAWDPAFSLLDSDTQIILLGLTLIADDEGRGLAQSRFLVRQFDKDATLVEQALTTLTETSFLAYYQIGNQRYEETITFLFTFTAKTSEVLLAAGLVVSTANFLTDGTVMGHND
jgi:hypothetical protein